ncbi:hypothetical protein KQX54_020615 [Cotesia glomerata]|uniref:Uncharacterized protein n=1 Tax=Cotesia glomerata TaxID=32391 RepID=A0AAV7I311_COTGL|nr:hypothetical protein KQX54_020615 [Cotesia glomerata]
MQLRTARGWISVSSVLVMKTTDLDHPFIIPRGEAVADLAQQRPFDSRHHYLRARLIPAANNALSEQPNFTRSESKRPPDSHIYTGYNTDQLPYTYYQSVGWLKTELSDHFQEDEILEASGQNILRLLQLR